MGDTIDKLPDSLWIEILAYLDFPSLLRASAISRRFYKLTQDRRFWRRLDLTTFRSLTLNDLRKLLRWPGSINIVSLRWEGYLRRSMTFPPAQRLQTQSEAVTSSFLEVLRERCPNLRVLHIIYATLDGVTLQNFPPRIRQLGFEGSLVPFQFFQPLNDPTVLSNLRGLDLNFCHDLSRLEENCLEGILSRPTLRFLQLKHCFNISASQLHEIPVCLSNLRTLNVSGLTLIDTCFVRRVAENARYLKLLDLSFCHSVGTKSMKLLATSRLCRLEKLYLIETRVNDDILIMFAEHQPQLMYINVVKTRCTATGVATFNEKTNGCCRIEHRSSEISDLDDLSFWWLDIDD